MSRRRFLLYFSGFGVRGYGVGRAIRLFERRITRYRL